jgi:hypothetical protein
VNGEQGQVYILHFDAPIGGDKHKASHYTKADPGQAITASTIATASSTVAGTRITVSTAGMLKGLYQWDVAAINASGQLIAGWSVPRSVQLE